MSFLPLLYQVSLLNSTNWGRELADTQARVRELEDALNAAIQSSTAEKAFRSTTPISSGKSVGPTSTSQVPITSSSVIPDSRSLEAAVTTFKWHIANCGLGSPLSSARAAFSSAVYQQTGHTFDLDELLLDAADSFEAQGFRSNRKPTTSKWPSSGLVQSCIDYYAKSGLYSMFPFADVDALQVLLNAEVLNHPQTTRAANIACLAAFTANITQMHRHDPVLAHADPDAYAQAALDLIPAILMETPDLRTLEAVIMLVRALISPVKSLASDHSQGHLHCPNWSNTVDRSIAGNCHTSKLQPRRAPDTSQSENSRSVPREPTSACVILALLRHG